MSWTDVLTWLGGSAVVSAGIASGIYKFGADRFIENHKTKLVQEVERLKGELAQQTETLKLKLRKQELVFNKQIDAAQAFVELRIKLEPSFSHPMMDAHEAAESMAEDLAKIEHQLTNYIAKQGHIWPETIRRQIRDCIGSAAENKFFVLSGPEDLPPEEAIEAASSILSALPRIEGEMLSLVITDIPVQQVRL